MACRVRTCFPSVDPTHPERAERRGTFEALLHEFQTLAREHEQLRNTWSHDPHRIAEHTIRLRSFRTRLIHYTASRRSRH